MISKQLVSQSVTNGSAILLFTKSLDEEEDRRYSGRFFLSLKMLRTISSDGKGGGEEEEEGQRLTLH